MKNRKRLIQIGIIAIILTDLILGWIFIYQKENPIQIERAIRAIDNGRLYEILEEDQTYLTKTGNHADLMHFFEGNFGIVYHTSYDDKVMFYQESRKVWFTVKTVRFNYTMWEKDE